MVAEYAKQEFTCVVFPSDGLQVAYEPDEAELQFTITQGRVEVGQTICLDHAQTFELLNFLLRAHHDVGRQPRPVHKPSYDAKENEK